MSNVPNTVLALDVLIRGTEYLMKLQQALAQAQAEGRDITDAELKTIRAENRTKLDDLLRRGN